MIHEYRDPQQEPGAQDELNRFIEIFTREGWLDKKIKIRYQDKLYWMSCNSERFFTYQINENYGLGPGVPGWPVYMLYKDFVYDESKIASFSPGALDGHNWLNIIANRNFEMMQNI